MIELSEAEQRTTLSDMAGGGYTLHSTSDLKHKDSYDIALSRFEVLQETDQLTETQKRTILKLLYKHYVFVQNNNARTLRVGSASIEFFQKEGNVKTDDLNSSKFGQIALSMDTTNLLQRKNKNIVKKNISSITSN